MMEKFTLTMRSILMAGMLAGLSGCGEEEAPPPPPPPPPSVGGTVSGLAGGNVVLQLNGAKDLAVAANGRFKFPGALSSGNAYAVTVKTQPSSPVNQTCSVERGSGTIANAPVSNIAVNCVTNTTAVGGTVKGLSGKGLVLELNGLKEVAIAKNGDFVFPEVRLPDGSDYRVALKSEPSGQKCEMKAISSAPDSETLQIVAVTCKKSRR